jgi:choline-sulfatase
MMQRAATGAAPPAGARKAAYAETYYQNVLLGWSPLRALRGPDWKFIEAPSPELYDLQADPAEVHNVIDRRSSIARAMAAALPAAAAAKNAASATHDTTERLRSLGYVAGRTDATSARGADPKDKIAVWNAIEEGIDESARNPGAAEAALRLAERLDSGNGLAVKYLADLRFKAGRMREAAEGYRQAIATGFRHADVYINLGAIAEREGRVDEARAAFAQATALAPADADAWNRLGMIEAQRGDLASARRAFERAIRVAPLRAEPYYNLGLVERRAGNEPAAEANLREAIARNSRYVEAQYALATGYLASHQPGRALEVYRAALAIKPDYAEALFGAARAALDLGRHDEARRDYERFIASAPPAYARQVAAAREALKRLR